MAAASNENEVSTYDVFLSFRGKDTRTNFTDHLYSAFKQAGFHTFRDDDELVRGDNIEADLHKAIRESRISVVVFSKDYASSTWCLDELVMIMKRMSDSCHTVLPIFYDVSPSQVRKQTQSFGSSFSKHEEQFNKETDRINQWRDALIAAANLSGMELKDRYESDFIRDVVRKLRNKLTPGTRDLSCHLVGAHLRAKEINMWLQEEAHDAWMAIIYGLGGVGKTTIAKILYNKNSERFASSSFISNVRDRSKEPSGLVRIQSQILSDILKGTTHDEVYDIEDGIVKIQKVICRKKILIIFDDVDDSNQLDALLGRRKIRLCPGSKIIFTTRHERLLKADHIYKKFEIKGLNQDESLELFSLHAFKQRKPIVDSYLTCSIEATKWCGGLPLALEVLGSSLCNRSIDVWEDTLQELKLYPDSTIQRVLRISYDSLRNDHDQNLFLNIVCFFVGGEKNYVTEILRGCGFFASKGIQNLLDRCLLSLDYNTLCMHQLLIKMGKEIVRQESPDDPGKRSRLWKHSDACIVLQDKTGSENIKGLVLDLHRLWGRNYVFNEQSMNVDPFPLSRRIYFHTESFRKMHKLQILQLYGVNLRGDYKFLPKKLVELCWHGFSLRCLPRNFQMEQLVSLDLSYSRIISVWDGTMVLPKLKFLNLSHCQQLTRVPNFGESPYVESLILRGCINIFEMDESIECLNGLLILNLEDCTSLKRLPKSLTTFESLEEINLSGCSNLEEMPEDLRKMKSLKVLNANGITINTTTNKETSIVGLLSSALWHPTVQSWLPPRKCLRSTNFSLTSLPSSLVELTLQNCNLSNDAFPSDLSYLGSLTSLNLSGNLFHSLPESISSLHVLKFLVLQRCRALQSLQKLPVNLLRLDTTYCSSLEVIENPIPSRTSAIFEQCDKLVEVKSFFKIYSIDNIDKGILRSLGLPNVESMADIKVELYNKETHTRMRASLQVLHDEVEGLETDQDKSSFYHIFIPGYDIPNCFSLRAVDRYPYEKFIYDIHPVGRHKICGFNLCISYTIDFSHYRGGGFHNSFVFSIYNNTKKNKWSYKPTCYAIPRDGEENILWLIHWNSGDQLEAGDEVEFMVDVHNGFHIHSIGISLDYEAHPNYVHQQTIGDSEQDAFNFLHFVISIFQKIT